MVRVLVVDDSAVARSILSAALASEPGIEVIAAVDPYDAREKVLRFAPDVITLDIEMPRMDGLSFLERLMKHHPIPVVIVSSLAPEQSEAAVRALQLGALEVIAKPASPEALPTMTRQLLAAVRTAAQVDFSRLRRSAVRLRPAVLAAGVGGRAAAGGRVIAVGASTGGPAALEQLLSALPADSPALLIVKHMPAGFTAAFARRLDARCAVTVREAQHGDAVVPGVALVAPGDRHMVLVRTAAGQQVALRNGPLVQYQRPSVDVLFHSIAQAAGDAAVAVLLTGMGSDGASGMRALRDAGAHTIAQDESTSVVFSMPREAIRFDGACDVLPLPRIAAAALAAAARDRGLPAGLRVS